MRIKLSVFLALSTLSCTSTVKQVANIDRVPIEQDNYHKPQVFIGDIDMKELNSGRKIASAEDTELSKLSNRQIYFFNLYKQTKIFSELAGVDLNIERSCPSFHNVIENHKHLLDFDISSYTLNQDISMVKENEENLPNYPVMALPVNERTDLYGHLKENNFKGFKKHLKSALKNYAHINKGELAQLCDKGVSENYYIFENFLSFYSKDHKFHSSKIGVISSFKVPIITNYMILDNLKKSSRFDMKESLELSLIQRSGVKWFDNYRKKINNKRFSHLGSTKNKLNLL